MSESWKLRETWIESNRARNKTLVDDRDFTKTARIEVEVYRGNDCITIPDTEYQLRMVRVVDQLMDRIHDLELEADDLVVTLENSDAWGWCEKYENVQEVLARRKARTT